MSKCRQSDPPKCFPNQARQTMNLDAICSMAARPKQAFQLLLRLFLAAHHGGSPPTSMDLRITCITLSALDLKAPASKRIQSADLISVFPPGRLLTGYLATFAVGSRGPERMIKHIKLHQILKQIKKHST